MSYTLFCERPSFTVNDEKWRGWADKRRLAKLNKKQNPARIQIMSQHDRVVKIKNRIAPG
jgi:hypothetical protein